RTASGLLYDSGDFTGNMKRVLDSADWKGFPARRRESKRRGRLRGIGISNYVETPVGIPHERVEVTVRAAGAVELAVGTQSTGQGHGTTFAQVMADLLGVKPEEIVFIGGDTEKIASGSGTHSDRSMRLGGTLMVQASGDVATQAKAAVAKLLGVSEGEVDFSDGLFVTPKSNRRLTIYDVARAVEDNPALAANGRLHAKATFTGRIPAYPTGCAICEVEVDPDTGIVDIVNFVAVDDFGVIVNPMIVEGQVHGGIAQGVGQALLEAAVYDKSSGQLVSGSYMDYAMPRADNLPSFKLGYQVTPCPHNPLGVKGCGEAGAIAAPAAVMNAVRDALAQVGAQDRIEMPATPQAVWNAIHAR
ncbi:MAG: molybdopterin-dependent oxidoreductase, partial [Alphaproteobacteria bacterium]|nr:molybdopterin-dependent oxidoreductase [Alphaproteobacteria bacterium]